MRRRGVVFAVVLAVASLSWFARPAVAADKPAAAPRLEFNRDIRPILSDACFHCHGPDKATRKADLRLDTQEGALADLGGYQAIVPASLARSELWKRVTTDDADDRMPPAKSGRTLTPAQIETLKRWIDEGAAWQPHWSLMPPSRPGLPAVQRPAWVRNPVDRFVLDKLERNGSGPSPEADRPTLLRRLSFDLTGLPPTPAESRAFARDRSPSAYQRVVARLLASPRYGERMAIRWLEAARYADTNGYQGDGERVMWRWRDWVIDAFNSNMPFDRFTIEQLAGDLVPGATLDQQLATGFHRNHRGNAEGGIIPEEYAVEYVVDRVETTGTVWLGMTIGCARCHDHKYDPVSQKDFYRMFSLFNNIPEKGKAIRFGNSPPFIKTPTPSMAKRLRGLDEGLTVLEARFATLAGRIARQQDAWEQGIRSGALPADAAEPHLDRKQVARFPLGKVEFDGARFLDKGDVARFESNQRFSFSVWVKPRGSNGGGILSRMSDDGDRIGYAIHLDKGLRLQFGISKRWLDDAIRVETRAALAPNRWHHIAVSYDGKKQASGVAIYLDGERQDVTVQLDQLNLSLEVGDPFRIGSRGTLDRFHGSVNDVRAYDDLLSPEEVRALATVEAVGAIVGIPVAKRSTNQAAKLRLAFLLSAADQDIQQARQRLLAARSERDAYFESIPTTMVMQEMASPRQSFVLRRGEYDKPMEKVTPGLPVALAPSQPLMRNRLDLARWLVDAKNPLTARVLVNRLWQMLFGTGLVKTAEDFGAQGEWPSHPELLDWLATELVRLRWDVKATLETLVMSATYRQASRVTPELLQKDPENRLLARGPRFRLPAEMVRDQALAVSGLLVDRRGGPSVKPYQPAGLWEDLGFGKYTPDRGEGLHRRSLYTFWKRTVAPPTLVTFDAASRESCNVRLTRTNTPLQALALLNDVTFVEAARVLAQRMLGQGAGNDADRVRFGFRQVLAREPRPAELEILLESLAAQRAYYGTVPDSARQVSSLGEAPAPAPGSTVLRADALAAYTNVASLLLNLDEAVTKE